MAKTKCFNSVGGAVAWTDGAFHGAKIHFFCEKHFFFLKKIVVSVARHCLSSDGGFCIKRLFKGVRNGTLFCVS